MQQSSVKFSGNSIEFKRSQSKMEEIDKSDVSFPHEPGAGTMEKATLVKLRSSETRLKFAIRALDSLCTTKVETLNWKKLERLQEHWNRYEDSFNAYQMLINQDSVAAAKHFFTLLEAFAVVDQRARTLLEISLSGGSVKMDKVVMYWCSEVPLIDKQESLSLSKQGAELKQGSHPDVLQGGVPEVADMKAEAEIKMDKGDEDKVKAEEVKNIAKQRLTTQNQLWQPWMSEVQEEAKLSSEAKEVRAVMRAKLNLLIKVEAKMDRMQRTPEEAMQLKKIEQVLKEKKMSKVDELENFAEAAEQPDFKELMLRQHNLNKKEVQKHADAKQLNYTVKVEIEAKENRMQMKKLKQGLKEEKMSRSAMDWHEIPPLIADKLVPPDREGSKAEAQASAVGSMKVVEIGAIDKLDEVEKDWQGSVLLAIDEQGLVELSVSKEVEMRLMHALKVEAVQFKLTEVKLMEVKLMEEKLMKLLKQCLELKACKEEGHEAPPLLVDKQAAAAG